MREEKVIGKQGDLSTRSGGGALGVLRGGGRAGGSGTSGLRPQEEPRG